MADVDFYHLTASSLDEALPKLLEKLLSSGARGVVLAGSKERAEHLDALFWTYRPDAFLPHGGARDGHAADQPIWLTDKDENPNGATILVLIDGRVPATLDGYQRCLDLFDGRDEDALAAARARWQSFKAQGHALTYWSQTPEGGWRKTA